MAGFTDLVVRWDERAQYVSVAGLNDKWYREMVISSGSIPEQLRNRKMTIVCPMEDIEKQTESLTGFLGDNQVKITGTLEPAVGVAEFYRKQKAYGNDVKDILVVDMNSAYTDITLIKNDADFTMRKSRRIDHGFDDLTDTAAEKFERFMVNNHASITNTTRKKIHKAVENQLITGTIKRFAGKEKLHFNTGGRQFSLSMRQSDLMELITTAIVPIMNEIERMTYCNRISQPVVLLSGRIWLWQEAVQFMKKRFPKWNIFAYRTEAVAILGAVSYIHRKNPSVYSYAVPDNFVYHNEDFWGEVSVLNDIQREGYWKILHEVNGGDCKISLRGTGDDLQIIRRSVRNDFPETCILWNWDHLIYRITKSGNSPEVEFDLICNPKGKQLMARIDACADNILKICTAGRKYLADDEIIRRLYCYMSEHYHYTRDKTASGEYPDYAYTLETLLRCGVCHGYATSLTYMLRKLQIPILYISGDADSSGFGRHAWNIVSEIDGSYRHMDLTWDLGKGNNESKMKYLIMDDIAMRSRYHFWDTQNYPACV